MSPSNGQRIVPSLRSYLICYLLYAALIALVVVVTFVIWRRAILNTTLAINGRHEANTIIYFASMVLMGLVSFIVVMTGEPYLRNGLARGLLLRRFARLALPFVVAGIIGLLLNLWATDALSHPQGVRPGVVWSWPLPVPSACSPLPTLAAA
jgi:magnesium-transporting ATPase (P-type)